MKMKARYPASCLAVATAILVSCGEREGCGDETTPPWLSDFDGGKLTIFPRRAVLVFDQTSVQDDAGTAEPAPTSSVEFAIAGYWGDGRLAEGAHVVVRVDNSRTVHRPDGSVAQAESTTESSIVLTSGAEEGCNQLSAGALDCVLLTDGTAKFRAELADDQAAGISHIIVESAPGSAVIARADVELQPDLSGAEIKFLSIDPVVTIPPAPSDFLSCNASIPECSDGPLRHVGPFSIEVVEKDTGKPFNLMDFSRAFAVVGLTGQNQGSEAWISTSPSCEQPGPSRREVVPVDPFTSQTEDLYICASAAPGTYRVFATMASLEAIGPEVSVAAQPARITLATIPEAVVGADINVVATLVDCAGAAIAGSEITFDSTALTINPPATSTTSDTGIASVTASAVAQPGSYEIVAELGPPGGGQCAAFITVETP